MAGTPLAGINGRVTCNGDTINQAKWSVNPKSIDLVTTNFESGGFEEGIEGVISCEITFEGFWDAGDNPHAIAGPSIRAGLIVGPLLLYVNKTGARAFNFPLVRFTDVRVLNEVEGKVMLSVTARSNGAFTYPT